MAITEAKLIKEEYTGRGVIDFLSSYYFLHVPVVATSCHVYKSVCDIIPQQAAQVPFVFGARTNRHGPTCASTCAFTSAWRGGSRLHG